MGFQNANFNYLGWMPTSILGSIFPYKAPSKSQAQPKTLICLTLNTATRTWPLNTNHSKGEGAEGITHGLIPSIPSLHPGIDGIFDTSPSGPSCTGNFLVACAGWQLGFGIQYFSYKLPLGFQDANFNFLGWMPPSLWDPICSL